MTAEYRQRVCETIQNTRRRLREEPAAQTMLLALGRSNLLSDDVLSSLLGHGVAGRMALEGIKHQLPSLHVVLEGALANLRGEFVSNLRPSLSRFLPHALQSFLETMDAVIEEARAARNLANSIESTAEAAVGARGTSQAVQQTGRTASLLAELRRESTAARNFRFLPSVRDVRIASLEARLWAENSKLMLEQLPALMRQFGRDSWTLMRNPRVWREFALISPRLAGATLKNAAAGVIIVAAEYALDFDLIDIAGKGFSISFLSSTARASTFPVVLRDSPGHVLSMDPDDPINVRPYCEALEQVAPEVLNKYVSLGILVDEMVRTIRATRYLTPSNRIPLQIPIQRDGV